MEDFADQPDLDAARGRPNTRIRIAGPDLNFVERDLDDSKLTGRQIAEAFVANDATDMVILQWLPNGMLEGVRLDETVDLRERGVERFIVGPGDGTRFFEIQGRRQEWLQAEITVHVIKILGNAGDGTEVVLEREDAADQVLEDDGVVRLDGPKVERLRFRSRAVTATIFVNNREVALTSGAHTGQAIKDAAIKSGVQIGRDFLLSLEGPGGTATIIGDSDEVEVAAGQRFLAIADDDNS